MTLELLKKELAVATLQQKLAKEVGLYYPRSKVPRPHGVGNSSPDCLRGGES